MVFEECLEDRYGEAPTDSYVLHRRPYKESLGWAHFKGGESEKFASPKSWFEMNVGPVLDNRQRRASLGACWWV
jgi:hypothetical protein